MVDFNNQQRPRNDTGKSMQSMSSMGTEEVDIDELNDRMQSFSQDLLELQAHKNSLKSFKNKIEAFVEKRTTVMVSLNTLAKNMAPNDIRLYQLTEQHKRSVKQYEIKARNVCMNMQAEKGNDLRIIEFFDDQIKKFEFRLGITPGILEASLVREQQREVEKEEKDQIQRATRPELGDIDFLDLGANDEQTPFNPPIVAGLPYDQNQTIKLAGVDESQASGKKAAGGVSIMRTPGVGVNDTANETIGGFVAMLNKEENDRSETGGEDYIDYKMLKDNKKNIGGPGGTGSSSDPYAQSSTLTKTNSANNSGAPVTNYMQAQSQDMNMSSASRARKNRQLENQLPAESKSKACADCTIF